MCTFFSNRISESCLFYSICTSLSISAIAAEWVSDQDRTTLINFTVSLTAASDSVGGGGGSLVCEATYCLNCCHTQLVCNKDQVRHSGKNLFHATAFSYRLQKTVFLQPSEMLALRCCMLHVRSGALLYMTPVVLVQAGRSNVWPSPAPYWRTHPSCCTTRPRLPSTPSPKRWVWQTSTLPETSALFRTSPLTPLCACVHI